LLAREGEVAEAEAETPGGVVVEAGEESSASWRAMVARSSAMAMVVMPP